ncbi:ABC transporter substrate-binding protein [Paenibacillus allorhizosphaerae]|uniref:Extracellular solute-binding protein n=1 Tax=Paenibacillus allorhizosphaerae TaxID=2849866 RepID=A0ABN7TG46_9BACL|nr:extracellular solute-binding protein [Paenibacillus allorhizosphaerae]CAG7626812.1 hypothetical protein PAECIP111802_01289 [Paenibacillus allorhizosphaerae]
MRAITILRLLTTLSIASAAMAGCGGKAEEANQAQTPSQEKPAFGSEPVVLKFYNHTAGVVTEEEMNSLIVKPVQKKYPNISFERVTGATLDQMVASGELPDLIGSANVYMYDMIAAGIASDLNPFIQRDKIDLSQLEPGTIDILKKFSAKGELFALPLSMNYGVMPYNKDIFDRFGVPYPKDNMTWNETIELAKRLTRMENGVQYIGLDMSSPQDLTRSYSLPTVDANHKALLDGPGYKKVFDLFAQLYAIPGIVSPNKKYKYGIDSFLKDQNMALFPYWIVNLTTRLPALKESGRAFNWDLVSWPSFDDKPGIGRQSDFHVMIVPPTSKNKEAAYRVLEVLISTEAQTEMNKGTRLTVLKDPQLKSQFASALKIYEGKNLQGVFKAKPAPSPLSTPYDGPMNAIMNKAMDSVAIEGVDVNTALREAKEKADKEIETMKK